MEMMAKAATVVYERRWRNTGTRGRIVQRDAVPNGEVLVYIRIWIVAVLVGMSIVMVRLSIADEPRSAAEAMKQGDQLREKGDLDGAIAAYTKAIELDPENALAGANRPLVTLTGTDSHVTEGSYHLIKSEKEWTKIWQRHKGVKESEDYDRFYNPLGLPEINFDKCMVIAAFQGSGWNSAGLSTTALKEEEHRIVFRFVSKGYQTAGQDGGRKRVTVYGFFVLSRSDKTVVVEEEHRRSRNPKDPPSWTERGRFQEARNQFKLPSQLLPLQIMFPDAPKTARDIEAFRSLRRAMTMMDVVRKCGLPDEDQGSGLHVFVYRLRDGSAVYIGTGDLKSLLYAKHVDKSGKATPLIPKATAR
jgi:hypothetical protein